MIRRFVIELEDTLKGYNEDVETLETRYGAEELPQCEWIRPTGWEDAYKGVVCSQCGKSYDVIEWSPEMYFCYNCGADMREYLRKLFEKRRKERQ